jgi:hypothetical protein
MRRKSETPNPKSCPVDIHDKGKTPKAEYKLKNFKTQKQTIGIWN